MNKRGNPAWTKGVSGNPNGKPRGTVNQACDLIRSDKNNLPRLLKNLRRLQKSKDESIALKATEIEMKFGWSYAPQILTDVEGNAFPFIVLRPENDRDIKAA